MDKIAGFVRVMSHFLGYFEGWKVGRTGQPSMWVDGDVGMLVEFSHTF